ncbi:MAG: ATPase domain-containing protein [Burkholderiaceae bacterium]
MKTSRRLIATGVPGLDELLHGGVVAGNNILVEGSPGAGKTTMGLQFLHHGAAELGEAGVIVAFELDSEKIFRDAEGFDLGLSALVDSGRLHIVHASPAVILDDLRSGGGVLEQTIRDMQARRLMIDGLTPLKLFARTRETSFREDIYLLSDALARLGVTTFVTAEFADDERHTLADERFVFDTILRMSRVDRGRSVHRRLEIVKSRGQDFVSGRHTMRITPGRGVVVYPRAISQQRVAVGHTTAPPRDDAPITAGSAAFDALLGGGLLPGSCTLSTGISGTGKTVAGLQFLMRNAALGRRGLLVTLDESPEQIVRNARRLGFPIEQSIASGLVEILYESPLELETDVHFDHVLRAVDALGARCVVFDSLAVYQSADPAEITDFLYALSASMKARGITSVMNFESPEMLGLSQISQELKGSHLVDNIVLLSYVEISTRLRRAILVPKVRGCANRQETHEFVIGPGGIHILDPHDGSAAGTDSVPQLPFDAYYGLLARSPTRQAPAIEKAVRQGDELDNGQPGP